MNWFLQKLVKGLTVRDWAFITRLPELRNNIYIADEDLAGPFAYHPCSESELPWFVVLLLGAYSKKHIFIPKPPSASLIRERLQDFRNRVKWAVCMGDTESHRQLPLVPRRVWECRKWVPAVVGPFTGAVSGLVYQKLEKLMHVRPKLPAFVVAGRKWLKSKGMVCVPSDKDGVFALAPRSLLNKLIYNELGKPCYKGYSPLSLEGDCTSLKAHLRAAARLAERLSLSWGNEIRSSADRVTQSSLLDSLLATVKRIRSPSV